MVLNSTGYILHHNNQEFHIPDPAGTSNLSRSRKGFISGLIGQGKATGPFVFCFSGQRTHAIQPAFHNRQS
jgi:hypothetical protein